MLIFGLRTCALLKRLGFEERIRGSHHIFRRVGIPEKIKFNATATKQNHIRYGKFDR